MDVAGQLASGSSLAITSLAFWRRLSSMAFSGSGRLVCRLPNLISVNLAEQGTGP